MKSSITGNLQSVVMQIAMLALLAGAGFLPAAPISHFSTTTLFLSAPAADVLLHYDTALAGASPHDRRVLSAATAQTVTHASIMWGSVVPQNPRPNADTGPEVRIWAGARDVLSSFGGNGGTHLGGRPPKRAG